MHEMLMQVTLTPQCSLFSGRKLNGRKTCRKATTARAGTATVIHDVCGMEQQACSYRNKCAQPWRCCTCRFSCCISCRIPALGHFTGKIQILTCECIFQLVIFIMTCMVASKTAACSVSMHLSYVRLSLMTSQTVQGYGVLAGSCVRSVPQIMRMSKNKR